jgi:hypothetical protein
MKHEDMQRRFNGHIKSATEHELWNLWVARDEDYRLIRTIALLGWALALTGPLVMMFG